MEVLIEIRLALIAAFLKIDLRNFAQYKISKENHSSSYFDITILGDENADKRKLKWDAMLEAVIEEFDTEPNFKVLDDQNEQIRLWVNQECELRQSQPKKELVVEIEEVVEVVIEQLSPPPSTACGSCA